MFDIGWTELLVIACVTVLVVGPKELPGLLRTLGKTVGNLRKMAGDFQKQFDEAMREAELDEVRKKMNAPFQPLEDARKAALDFQQKVTDTVRIPEISSATPAPAPAAEVAASIPEPALAPQLASPPAELQAATVAAVSGSAGPASPAPAPAGAAAATVAAKAAPKKAASAPPAASGKAKAAARASAGTKSAESGKTGADKVAVGAAGAEKAKSRTGRKS